MFEKKNPIPLSVPHFSGREWELVKECLDTGWISTAGTFVGKLEERMAAFAGRKHAVAVMNGTSALHLSLLAAGVGPGDEVLVPTLTFIAPINAVRYVDARPVFMDCDGSLNIDPAKVNEFCETECRFEGGRLINKKTGARVKAILAVHVFGHPAHVAPLVRAAERYGLVLIEDAAESLGSSYKSGRQTGAVGDIGCYSFNGNKIVTGGGGGMIVTDSNFFADKARYYSTQAKDDPENFVHDEVGYNYRLTNIHAAIAYAQMDSLEEYVRIKCRNFQTYQDLLSALPGFRLLAEPGYAKSNYWLTTALIDEEEFGLTVDEIKKNLASEGIETRCLWPLNHTQKPYLDFQSYRIEKAPGFAAQVLNLPSSVGLSDDDLSRVAECLAAVRMNGRIR